MKTKKTKIQKYYITVPFYRDYAEAILKFIEAMPKTVKDEYEWITFAYPTSMYKVAPRHSKELSDSENNMLYAHFSHTDFTDFFFIKDENDKRGLLVFNVLSTKFHSDFIDSHFVFFHTDWELHIKFHSHRIELKSFKKSPAITTA